MVRSSLLMFGILLTVQGISPAIGQDHKADQQKGSNVSAVQGDESIAGDHYYCRITEMPTSWGTRSQPVKIVHSDAVFSELGTTVPALDVLNTQASSITNLTFVIEYLDKQGHRSTTAAITAAASGYEKAVRLPFSVEGLEAWKKPLETGETARVSGIYDVPPRLANVNLEDAKVKFSIYSGVTRPLVVSLADFVSLGSVDLRGQLSAVR